MNQFQHEGDVTSMISAHPTLRRAYRLVTEIWSPQPLDQVFEFFADAHNLEELTPSFLQFQVLTPAPIPMRAGITIDYQLRLYGFPLRWRSLICAWEPPFRFVDEQITGPYSFWHHEHTFESINQGTRIRDVVDYGVPGGKLVHALFVRPSLEKIFAFRRSQMEARFGQKESPGDPALLTKSPDSFTRPREIS